MKTCAALMTTSVLLGLVSLWWWALAGMSEEIGTATTVTASGLFLVGLIGALDMDA